jgi:hypothetical protein
LEKITRSPSVWRKQDNASNTQQWLVGGNVLKPREPMLFLSQVSLSSLHQELLFRQIDRFFGQFSGAGSGPPEGSREGSHGDCGNGSDDVPCFVQEHPRAPILDQEEDGKLFVWGLITVFGLVCLNALLESWSKFDKKNRRNDCDPKHDHEAVP